MSEYDFILKTHKDGSYKIMPVEEKILLPPRVIYLDVFDPEKGKEFVVLYRDRRRSFGVSVSRSTNLSGIKNTASSKIRR